MTTGEGLLGVAMWLSFTVLSVSEQLSCWWLLVPFVYSALMFLIAVGREQKDPFSVWHKGSN